MAERPRTVDSGYSWVIVFATFIMLILAVSVVSSNTLILNYILLRFQESNAFAGWLLSSKTSVGLFNSPFVGLLYIKFSYRTVAMIGMILYSGAVVSLPFCSSIGIAFISYGVIDGVGISMIYMSTSLSLCSYFDEKLATALGLSGCGTGFGLLIFPHVIAWCFDNFEFTQTMIILGGVLMQSVAIIALHKPNGSHNGPYTELNEEKSVGKKMLEKSGIHLLRSPTFTMIALASSFIVCSYFISSVYVSGLAVQLCHVNNKTVALILSLGSLGLVGGRFSFGIFLDLKVIKQRRVYVYLFCTFLLGNGLIVISFSSNLILFICMYTLITFLAYGLEAQQLTIFNDFVKEDEKAGAVALSRFITWIVLLVVPALVGLFKDEFDSYRVGFIFTGLVSCSITVIAILTNFYHQRINQQI